MQVDLTLTENLPAAGFPAGSVVCCDKTKTTGVDTMAEQEMLLDIDTIKAAVAGEKWAKDKVIEHYTPMIDELAVDEDMKQHLILKLLEELPHFPMEQE